QLITRQDNTMLTWQQIKRIRRLEIKGKTPIWFKKLEETILEDQISRRIKGNYAQQKEVNESQIKPKKRKMSHKRSKKEWVYILEWEENKENLVHDNSSSSSITPTNKILKMRENEVEDVTPDKKTRGKKESEVEHVTLAESWDVYLIQNLVENREKQRELTQALEKNQKPTLSHQRNLSLAIEESHD
ncbi:16230_t:CDS:2, partial [Gigaspora rosea]